MHHRFRASLRVLLALFGFSAICFSQTGQPSESKKSPTESSTATHLSHDLNGVWMQYDDGTAPDSRA